MLLPYTIDETEVTAFFCILRQLCITVVSPRRQISLRANIECGLSFRVHREIVHPWSRTCNLSTRIGAGSGII